MRQHKFTNRKSPTEEQSGHLDHDRISGQCPSRRLSCGMENYVWRNYGPETRPPGEWVRTTGIISVQGVGDNRDAVIAFADAVEASRKKGLRFGVDLAAEDIDNPEKGLLVVGGAESKGFFGGRTIKHWPLGYLSEKIVSEIHDELIEKSIPIAAELTGIHYDRAQPEVKICILAPEGHGARDRERRRRAKPT